MARKKRSTSSSEAAKAAGRHVALLRGVNVGGHRKVPMRDLAALFTSLGFEDVRTFLNSGNVVFYAETVSAARLEEAIEAAFGFHVEVALRAVDELATVAAEVPFPQLVAPDPSRLHVAFYVEERDPPQVDHAGPELIRAGRRHAWVWYPEGAGKSKLNLERLLGTRVTARNLRTVTALASSSDSERADRINSV